MLVLKLLFIIITSLQGNILFIFLQLYNRHALYLASQVGPGFDPVVSLAHVKMTAIDYYQVGSIQEMHDLICFKSASGILKIIGCMTEYSKL